MHSARGLFFWWLINKDIIYFTSEHQNFINFKSPGIQWYFHKIWPFSYSVDLVNSGHCSWALSISLSSSISFAWIRKVIVIFLGVFNCSGLHLVRLIFANFSSILYLWQLKRPIKLFTFFICWGVHLGFCILKAWLISSIHLPLFFRSTSIPIYKNTAYLKNHSYWEAHKDLIWDSGTSASILPREKSSQNYQIIES